MLHLEWIKCPEDYFKYGLSKDNAASEYYSGEVAGRWLGKGATHLGLYGRRVSEKAFTALCRNQHPTTGEQLTARKRKRTAIDARFDGPKSVSCALLFDRRVTDVFMEAVRETMTLMESVMAARVRKNNATGHRLTKNLVAAEFIHFTSRPVSPEAIPDIQLHAHVVCISATLTEEGLWKAGEFFEIKKSAPYYQSIFHAKLARKLVALGYAIERKPNGRWEIAGVPQSLITKFSKRSRQINAKAKDLGITSPAAKAKLAKTTRSAKQRKLTRAGLLKAWEKQLTSEEAAAMKSLRLQAPAHHDITADEALAFALSHLLERAAVASEQRLIAAALDHGIGSVSLEEVLAALDQASVIRCEINGEKMVTTPQMLALEQEMIRLATNGLNACAPLYDELAIEFNAIVKDGDVFELTEEQKVAIVHVLTSSSRTLAIRGKPGTGKTTLLREAVRLIEQTGVKVHAFAPTAEASRGVLRAEGFEDAQTLQMLLTHPDQFEITLGDWLLLDEANLASTQQMRDLLQIATRNGARVLLSGDTGQHGPVEQISAMKVLERYAHITPVEVRSIQRQSGIYRKAAAALANGEIAVAFKHLERMQAIKEIPPSKLYDALAREYLRLSTQRIGNRYASVLAIAPTHKEGAAVTNAIRKRLKRVGLLGPEREYTRLVGLSLTDAQKKDPASYEHGQVVQFHKHAEGIKAGLRLPVTSATKDKIEIQRPDGTRVGLPLDQASRFEVYRAVAIDLAVGDRIRITCNSRSKDGHRLLNGGQYTIQRIERNRDLRLNNGWRLSHDHGHLHHGYVSTSHKAESRTVDYALVAQTSVSIGASDQRQANVTLTRARRGIQVFTDDKAALLKAVSRERPEMSATELSHHELRRDRLHRHARRLTRWLHHTRARAAERAHELAKRYRELSRDRQRDWGLGHER